MTKMISCAFQLFIHIWFMVLKYVEIPLGNKLYNEICHILQCVSLETPVCHL